VPLPTAADDEAATPASEVETREPADAPMSAQAISGWVVTAVGGAAFISTVVTGSLAIQKHQQLAALCPERTCEPALHAHVDQFNAFRMAATASVIAAGAATTVGLALLLTAPTGDQAAGDGARLHLEAAPGGLRIRGTF
jgi:hypothetical protein